MSQDSYPQIGIVGGGAAGFFCAINLARKAYEQNIGLKVSIFESSHQYLKKVRISGGGRCNVTHNLFEVRPFTENYPRGARELLSPFQRFQAKDTIQWFNQRDIEIVAEEDGRMFPSTNQSQTIIDCFVEEAEKFGVDLVGKSPVKEIARTEDGQFELVAGGNSYTMDSILIATGSAPAGYRLAQSLGHKITDLAPSLFSFKIKDPLLSGLSGLSFPSASLKLKTSLGKKFNQMGPTLITHWGLSGPAILKLSAWAAREMKAANYQATLTVNWLGLDSKEEAEELINQLKTKNLKSLAKNTPVETLPKRFWQSLLLKSKISDEKQWANLSKKEQSRLASALFETQFVVQGQNRFKEEFVECGGISLKEVNFKTMESKICENLYFAGEILDVDGITGGFNFQNAWTSAWITSESILQKLS